MHVCATVGLTRFYMTCLSPRSCRQEVCITTSSTSSSWGMRHISHIFCKLMCLLMVPETVSSASTCGSTLLPTFTHTHSCGQGITLCKGIVSYPCFLNDQDSALVDCIR